MKRYERRPWGRSQKDFSSSRLEVEQLPVGSFGTPLQLSTTTAPKIRDVLRNCDMGHHRHMLQNYNLVLYEQTVLDTTDIKLFHKQRFHSTYFLMLSQYIIFLQILIYLLICSTCFVISCRSRDKKAQVLLSRHCSFLCLFDKQMDMTM